LSAIEHILEHRPDRIQTIFIHGPSASGNPRVISLYQKARAARIKMDASPQIVRADEPARALIAPYDYTDFHAFLSHVEEQKTSVVLALDHLQDPQNFGALCRTAEGLGISGILTPKDRGVTLGPGVYHASVGAVETIPVSVVPNLGEALRKLKDAGFWIVGTSLGRHAKPPSEMPDFSKVVLVLGSELEGLSPTIEKQCDWHVEIPLKGKVQSLNVSVAGGILLYQMASRLSGPLH
jgi:23S rRNA (guanosine2251-2'-O)-methyltransferase